MIVMSANEVMGRGFSEPGSAQTKGEAGRYSQLSERELNGK